MGIEIIRHTFFTFPIPISSDILFFQITNIIKISRLIWKFFFKFLSNLSDNFNFRRKCIWTSLLTFFNAIERILISIATWEDKRPTAFGLCVEEPFGLSLGALWTSGLLGQRASSLGRDEEWVMLARVLTTFQSGKSVWVSFAAEKRLGKNRIFERLSIKGVTNVLRF